MSDRLSTIRSRRRSGTSLMETMSCITLLGALISGIGQVWWMQRRVGAQTESTIALAQQVERLAFRLRIDARQAHAARFVPPPVISPAAPIAPTDNSVGTSGDASAPEIDPDTPAPAVQLRPAPATTPDRAPRGGWDMVGSDERVVEYRVEGSIVRRTARTGAQVEHRDSFHLPVGSSAKLRPADPAQGRPLPQIVITRASVERSLRLDESSDEGEPLIVIDLAVRPSAGGSP